MITENPWCQSATGFRLLYIIFLQISDVCQFSVSKAFLIIYKNITLNDNVFLEALEYLGCDTTNFTKHNEAKSSIASSYHTSIGYNTCAVTIKNMNYLQLQEFCFVQRDKSKYFFKLITFKNLIFCRFKDILFIVSVLRWNVMSSENERILVLVTPFPKIEWEKQEKADSIYYRVNNILLLEKELKTAKSVCNYCKKFREELIPQINEVCYSIKNNAIAYNAPEHRINRLFNSIEKKKLRVVLYPGNREDINDLIVNEATHSMIVQFSDSDSLFKSAEPHEHTPPLFYQICNTEDTAIKYIEALLIDACMCHYMKISDAAMHNSDKQNISKDKVQFLKDSHYGNTLDYLSSDARSLIKYVCEQLNDDTPYISFMSIFTIASVDQGFEDNIEKNINTFFADYYELWKHFQRWYYKKSGRLFSKEDDIIDPIRTIFEHNKYKGQISPDIAANAVKEELRLLKNNKKPEDPIKVFGYAFVILCNMPDDYREKAICDALFNGPLHQAKWKIVPWEKIKDFKKIEHLVEIVPFLLEA